MVHTCSEPNRDDPISRVLLREILKSYYHGDHKPMDKTKLIYSLRFPFWPCDHCDKWNNSIPRGSARRKYNAVNVIYRINHDLLCGPESTREILPKTSYLRTL